MSAVTPVLRGPAHFNVFQNLAPFLFFLLLARPVACAPPAEENGLAPSVAKALTKAKLKSVVVFDFIGPGEKLNQLGQNLAEGLSLSLANSSGKFTLIDRAALRAVIEKNLVTPDVVREPEIA